MSMSHSPEPWSIPRDDYADIRDANDAMVMGGDSDDYRRADGDDIERIVACVNACRGIPTDVLLSRDKLIDRYKALQRETIRNKGYDPYDD